MFYSDPISTRDAAAILGISHVRVLQLKQKGRLTPDDAGKLSLADVRQFKDGRGESDDDSEGKSFAEIAQESRARRERAEAEKAEIELRELKGRLVDIDEVLEDAKSTAQIINSALDVFPGQIAPKLEGKTQTEIKRILTQEISKMKQSLYDSRFISDGCPGGVPTAGADNG